MWLSANTVMPRVSGKLLQYGNYRNESLRIISCYTLITVLFSSCQNFNLSNANCTVDIQNYRTLKVYPHVMSNAGIVNYSKSFSMNLNMSVGV